MDNGSGWSDAGKQYTAGDYTFTPANENSKLAAVVFPMGNYLEPAEGVSAGVLSNVKTIETTTTLTVDSTDYEGSTAIVTAKVETNDKKAVLDGLVEFYVQYGVENSGDYTKYTFATSRLNKNGEAAVTFEVPIYSIGTYQFYAHYVGTEVYGASSSGWSTKTAIKSATIAFGTSPALPSATPLAPLLPRCRLARPTPSPRLKSMKRVRRRSSSAAPTTTTSGSTPPTAPPGRPCSLT